MSGMKNLSPVLVLALVYLIGCNKAAKTSSSAAPTAPAAAPSTPADDAVQQKLQEYAGAGATNCGRLNTGAAADLLKSASDCAMQASQGKKPFTVAYAMPGMSVGVAGNSAGKLFTAQMQGMSGLSSGDCPSALRVASSGRVTCFAPGDMGSMSGSHSAGSMPPGVPNPHTSGGSNPHTSSKSN
jgi:hypothetical protein